VRWRRGSAREGGGGLVPEEQTYIDDATGEVHDKKNAVRIFLDMECIIENGGFWFKKTVMMGDPLDETEELWEVLSLRGNWEGWDLHGRQMDGVWIRVMWGMLVLDLLEVGNKWWPRGAQADHRQDSSGPSSGVTIPRVELVAAVNSVQLTRKFKESLKLTFKK
jgi:hypothetical protein